MNFRYPVAWCPKCDRPIVYSDNPKDKNNIKARKAEPDYHGKTILCACCKTMLAVVEMPAAVDCLSKRLYQLDG